MLHPFTDKAAALPIESAKDLGAAVNEGHVHTQPVHQGSELDADIAAIAERNTAIDIASAAIAPITDNDKSDLTLAVEIPNIVLPSPCV